MRYGIIEESGGDYMVSNLLVEQTCPLDDTDY